MRAGGLAPLLILSLPLLASVGCRNHSQELLESELRTKEIQYRETLDALKQSRLQNEALYRELIALRHGGGFPVAPQQPPYQQPPAPTPKPSAPTQKQPAPPLPPPIVTEKALSPTALSPETASRTYTLQRITLGRFTGGRDDDGLQGDEVLQVILEPRDEAGDIIKAPGMLQVFALEVARQGTKTLLCSWEIPALRLRPKWRNSLFVRGYDFKLRWKNWPTTENLRIVARFFPADGRMFEADRDVTVRLTPGADRLQHTPPAPTPGPTLPTDYPLLPMPREVGPELPVLGPAHTSQRVGPAPSELENAIQLHRAGPAR